MRTFLLSLFLGAFLQLSAKDSLSYEKVADQAELKILSPTLSERKSTKLRLANGLEAYLISDPGVEQSAAALAVEAGSWNDPEAYPGMAHFLEHMLFMGTKPYPKEAEFMQFVSDHGGKVNAYTASDRTVYMFSINNDGFNAGLNRFAHFFIDPLFLPSGIERELHAVDQEHAKNLEHDGWRQYMIFKETGNASHPNAKFSTGNADTLRGIPQEAMKDWYKENYTANRMHLVILSPLPLEQLIDQTTKDFSAVPTNGRAPVQFSADIATKKQQGHMIYIKPVKDLKILNLTWELPENLAKDNDVQIGNLLAYVLNNGSKNSLLGLLKKEHLATAINVAEDAFSKTNKLLSIDVELSDLGIEQLNTVITYCFEALARLKKTGIPRYVFDEVQRISQLKYEYQSRTDAFEFIKTTAGQLVDEELETFPRKTLIPTKFDPELISNYIHALSAEKCIFFIVADPAKTNVSPTKEERWMQAEYAVVPIPQKQLLAWDDAHINPKIGLAPPNPFIPKNMTLVNAALSDAAPIPTLLQDTDQGKIYFAEDHQYLCAEVAHIFRLRSPFLDGSAKSKVLSDLYVKALDDHLFPITSAAKAAGSNVTIKPDHLTLIVAVNGYSDQSDKLVDAIFTGMKKVKPSRQQFELYKQSLIASYENTEKELPLLQSFELLNSTLFNDAPISSDKLLAIQTLSYEDFLDFSSEFLKKLYVEGLLYGNLTRESADKLWASLKKKIKADGYPVAEQHKRRVLVLSEGQGPYMLTKTTPMLGNSAVLVVEQGSYSFEKRAAQQVLGSILKTEFFETLRTKQQTAYIAKAWEKEEEKQLLQFFAVQSSTHQPGELIARFELFLEDFVKQYTMHLPEERFEKVRSMAIASLEMPPENLMLMGTRLFLLGFEQDGDFQLIDKRIAALQKLTYAQTRAVAKETFSRSNTRRIAVLFEGMTPKEKDFRYEEVSKQELLNQGTFVAWK